MLRSKQILSIKNKLCIRIAGKCPPHLCDISGSTSALASVGASVIVGKKPKNGFFYLTRFGWVAAVMADFRTRAAKGKGFYPRGGVPVREFPSLLEAFFAIWLLACVAGVSNRVIARKLEREQKKKVEGGGGGEKRKSFIPSPSPVIPFFFALVPFSTNSRGNACYAGYLAIGSLIFFTSLRV